MAESVRAHGVILSWCGAPSRKTNRHSPARAKQFALPYRSAHENFISDKIDCDIFYQVGFDFYWGATTLEARVILRLGGDGSGLATNSICAVAVADTFQYGTLYATNQTEYVAFVEPAVSFK